MIPVYLIAKTVNEILAIVNDFRMHQTAMHLSDIYEEIEKERNAKEDNKNV